MTAQQIEKLALQLSADERAELVERLRESLHTPMSAEIEKAWVEEAERRYELYKQGKIPAHDAADVIREAYEKYGAKR